MRNVRREAGGGRRGGFAAFLSRLTPPASRLALLALAVASVSSFADQYRSEQRVLETPPPPAKDVNTEQLLKQTTDPYARALLLRDLAWQAVAKKEYDKASKYLEESLALGALAPQAAEQMRKDLLQLQVASGEPSAVIKALEPKVKSDPQSPPEMKAALAGAYLEQKRYKEALPLLRDASASPRPEESWLQGLYAAYMGLNQPKDAIPVLERLVRINPRRAEYWLQLAGLNARHGGKEKTLALLELASRQGYLQNEDHLFQVIALTAELGAPFEAGSLMQSWMEAGRIERNARNWEMLAGVWIEARETALSIRALREAIKLAPRPDLYVALGQQHMEREEYAQAAEALASGATRGQETGPLLTALGTASYYAGNLENARAAFREAQRHKATAGTAREWLAFLDLPAAQEQARVFAAEAKSAGSAPVQVALSHRLSAEPVQLKPVLFDTPAPPGAAPDLRRIGGRLTDVGAEADANADGTIPAWDGGLQKAQWPGAFKPGGKLVDPYPGDKPLFTITAANAAQYVARLSGGHKQMLAQYPGYKLPVYPTRRSASYPKEIYDATQANLGKAKLIGSDALTGARLGFPFPQPQNGVEVMWNHRTRYRGDSHYGVTSQAVVGKNGITSELKGVFRVLFRYGNIKDPADIAKENMLVYGVTWVGQSVQGNPDVVALFHETANSIEKSRGIWVLLRMGKMLRIPPVGYDQPFFGSEGLYFLDMIDMYNGAFDRYNWKLVGKRELYIPYNAYRLSDGSIKNDALLKHPYLNQDATRYELHRVWIVEATERGGTSHAFGKRVFYVDEDSWNVVLVENHDRQGRLWRFQEGHLINIYDIQSTNAYPIVTYDFKENRYFAHRLLAEDPPLQFNVAGMDDQDFLPAAVKRKYAK